MTVMATGIWYVLAIRYMNNLCNKDEMQGCLGSPVFLSEQGKIDASVLPVF